MKMTMTTLRTTVKSSEAREVSELARAGSDTHPPRLTHAQ